MNPYFSSEERMRRYQEMLHPRIPAHWHCERCGAILQQKTYCTVHMAYGLACDLCETQYTYEHNERRFHLGVHDCANTSPLPDSR
jgi:transcription elongation factor Elf1